MLKGGFVFQKQAGSLIAMCLWSLVSKQALRDHAHLSPTKQAYNRAETCLVVIIAAMFVLVVAVAIER